MVINAAQPVTFCFYNSAVEPEDGRVIIEKFVYNPGTNTWDLHAAATPFTFDIDPDNGGTTHSGVGPPTYEVTPGDYTVSEVLPVAGYEFVALLMSLQACPEVPLFAPVPTGEVAFQVLAQQLTDSTIDISVLEDQTVRVCAHNEPTDEVNLFVRKFQAPASNAFTGTTGLSGWTITLDCLAGECEEVAYPGSLVTNGGGLASFGAVPLGTYEVCEVPQAGFTVVGSLLNVGAPVGGTCREVSVTEAAADPEGNIVVDFFNYRIPETATPTPENTSTVTPTPIIPVFPTSTPTTPPSTSTPVDPTSTPVVPTSTPDPVDPTATPTPIDEVEGEITPGASPTTPASSATPIPPASGTGNGILGGGTGSSMFMVLLALIMTSTGLAALAMARRRANGASRS